MSRSKTAVHWLSEGECLVRGTTDPATALGLAWADSSNGGWNWEDAVGDRPEECEADRVHATHAADAAAFCYGRLNPRNQRAGWFRRNIQPPGGDLTWLLGEPVGPGRGNFRGVLFD